MISFLRFIKIILCCGSAFPAIEKDLPPLVVDLKKESYARKHPHQRVPNHPRWCDCRDCKISTVRAPSEVSMGHKIAAKRNFVGADIDSLYTNPIGPYIANNMFGEDYSPPGRPWKHWDLCSPTSSTETVKQDPTKRDYQWRLNDRDGRIRDQAMNKHDKIRIDKERTRRWEMQMFGRPCIPEENVQKMEKHSQANSSDNIVLTFPGSDEWTPPQKSREHSQANSSDNIVLTFPGSDEWTPPARSPAASEKSASGKPMGLLRIDKGKGRKYDSSSSSAEELQMPIPPSIAARRDYRFDVGIGEPGPSYST